MEWNNHLLCLRNGKNHSTSYLGFSLSLEIVVGETWVLFLCLPNWSTMTKNSHVDDQTRRKARLTFMTTFFWSVEIDWNFCLITKSSSESKTTEVIEWLLTPTGKFWAHFQSRVQSLAWEALQWFNLQDNDERYNNHGLQATDFLSQWVPVTLASI